jgi:hypothetical protein
MEDTAQMRVRKLGTSSPPCFPVRQFWEEATSAPQVEQPGGPSSSIELVGNIEGGHVKSESQEDDDASDDGSSQADEEVKEVGYQDLWSPGYLDRLANNDDDSGPQFPMDEL